MAKQSLLLVDGDVRSLRVLEVSLKKSGYNVTTAVNGRDALDKVQTAQPDLIISDTDMTEMDGFGFCERLKSNPEWEDIPFIFLTGQTSIENKIRGLELGVADYLTKPIYIKEITTRVGILLQKTERARLEAERDSRTRFSGLLVDMGIVDLIQTIEISRKSGLIHFKGQDGERAAIYFRTGKVIDAEAGRLVGEDAVYRLLTWSEGEFEVEFRNVRRKDVIEMSSQGLLMEGMRRLDEWGRHLEQLPPLDSRFEVDAVELSERLPELPDQLNSILKLFDARRSLLEIIDASSFGDLECLEVISKLYFEGLIVEVSNDQAPETLGEGGTDLSGEGWLNAAPLLSPEMTEEEELSSDELDEIGVALALRPNLVDEAIAAAPPVTSEGEASLEPDEEGDEEVDAAMVLSTLQTSTEVDLEEPVIAAAMDRDEEDEEDEDEVPDALVGRRTIPGFAAPVVAPLPERKPVVVIQLANEFDSEPTPLPRPDPGSFIDEPSSPGTKSSAGAEVASASGIVDSDFREKPTNPARELITIRPREEGELLPAVVPRERAALGKRADTGNDGTRRAARRSVRSVAPAPEEASARAADLEEEDADESREDQTPTPPRGIPKPEVRPLEEDDGAAEPEDDEGLVDDADPAEEDEDEEVAVGPALHRERGGRGRSSAASSWPDELEARSSEEAARDQPRSSRSLITGVIVVIVVAVLGGFLIARGCEGAPSSGRRETSASSVNLDGAVAGSLVDASLAENRVVRSPPIDAAPVVEVARVDAASVEAPVAKGFKEFMEEARRAHRHRRYDEALVLVDQAIAERRASRAFQLKADILLSKGDPVAALEVANRAVDIAPRSAQGWLTKGMLHYELKQYGEAKRALERYLALSPKAGNADTIRMLIEEM